MALKYQAYAGGGSEDALESARNKEKRKKKRQKLTGQLPAWVAGGGRLRNPGGFSSKRGRGADRTGDLAVAANPDLLRGAEAPAPPQLSHWLFWGGA